MALLDSMLDFTKSDPATIAAAASTTQKVIGKAVDLRTHTEPFAGRVGQAANTTGKIDTRRLDVGRPLYLTIKVVESVTSGVIAFRLVTDSALSSGAVRTTASVLVATGAMQARNLEKGEAVQLMLPQPFPPAQRYLGVTALVSTNLSGSMKVWAYLTDAPEFTEHYPEAAN